MTRSDALLLLVSKSGLCFLVWVIREDLLIRNSSHTNTLTHSHLEAAQSNHAGANQQLKWSCWSVGPRLSVCVCCWEVGRLVWSSQRSELRWFSQDEAGSPSSLR